MSTSCILGCACDSSSRNETGIGEKLLTLVGSDRTREERTMISKHWVVTMIGAVSCADVRTDVTCERYVVLDAQVRSAIDRHIRKGS